MSEAEQGYWLASQFLETMAGRFGYLRDSEEQLIGDEHGLVQAVLDGRWPVDACHSDRGGAGNSDWGG